MTLDAAAVVIGFALVVLWLIALTMGQARTRARVGEPVYRRLPDGRIRFEWQVGTTYPAARRASKTGCGPP
ncbi:MAG: hypothetical protein ACRDQ0_15500 [Pseudonocardia sp.]